MKDKKKTGLRNIFSKSRGSLIIVLLLIFIMFYMVNEVISLNIEHEEQIIDNFDIIEHQNNRIVYKAIRREAEEKVSYVSTKLRSQLVDMYDGDFNDFIREYDESSDNSKFIKVLNDVLENEEDRFFHVKNDENDIFIISPKEVLADKSKRTASRDGEDRLLEFEVNKYENAELAKQVFDNITGGRKDDLFLQISSEGTVIKDLDINKVLSMPLEELRHFEFLTISYIDEYGDLTTCQDVDKKGKEQVSRKIILIQSFNLYDQIVDLNIDKNYNVIRSSKQHILEKHRLERRIYSFIGTLTVIIFIVSFLTMACLKNRYVRERGNFGVKER